MEVTYKIGDRKFKGSDKPSFLVASLIEQKVGDIRAVLLGDQENPKPITVNQQFIEDYFMWQDWLEIFQAHLKLTSEPQWITDYSPMGEVIGKHLDNFFSYKDMKEMPVEIAEDIKKNLKEPLNYGKMSSAPLTMQIKLWREFLQKLKSNPTE